MSNVLSLIVNHKQAKLGSFQLRFKAGTYQLFDGLQIIELADRASLRFGDLTITVCHSEEVNLLRELSHTHTAQDNLGFLKSQGLPLTNITGQAQKLTMLDQHFRPPNAISEQQNNSTQTTELTLKIISSGNILRDLGFL